MYMNINIYDLLCAPTGGRYNSSGETLSVSIVEQLSNAGVLQPQDFTKIHEGLPLWVWWVTGNKKPQLCVNFLYEVLPKTTGFSWVAQFENNAKSWSEPLDVMGEYLTFDQLNTIVHSLDPQQLQKLKNKPLTTSKSFGLKKMVRFKREDLLECLVSNGWDINICNDAGQSLLMNCGSWDEAQSVLKYKPNVEVVDNKHNNILDCVRKWSGETPFKDILNEVNKHRLQNMSSNTHFEKLKGDLFAVVASQKVADLNKVLKGFKSLESVGVLEDELGRSPVSIVLDGITPFHRKSASNRFRFCIRFLNYFAPEMNNNSYFGKDRPLKSLSGWSEYDHMMMVLLVNRAENYYSSTSELMSTELKDLLKQWCVARLPQLKNSVVAWSDLYLKDLLLSGKRKESPHALSLALNHLCASLTTIHGNPDIKDALKEFTQVFENPQSSSAILNFFDIANIEVSSKTFSQRNFQHKDPLGTLACVYGVNNTVINSDLEDMIVMFCLEKLHEVCDSYHHGFESFHSPIQQFMEEKLSDCLDKHPHIRNAWLQSLPQDYKETLERRMEEVTNSCVISESLYSFIDKQIILSQTATIAKTGKICQRKM